ncbi:MAG: Ig-like domain-containing protein [candidate division Zixibacteria bacterium]
MNKRPVWSPQKSATLAIISLTLLLSNCAEIVAPPGGPVDKRGPQLISSDPINGATNVAPSDLVTLTFSERLIAPEKGRPVFISPRQTGDLKIEWKSERILIHFPDSFQTDQTYLISVAASVTDLRRNKLDSTLTIAFTTGDKLDSGQVSGFVLAGEAGVPLASVALFEAARLESLNTLDSIVPDYGSICNDAGYFSFSYLPPNEFVLIGWVDKNRNEFVDIHQERYAVPDRPIDIAGFLPLSDLTLPLATRRTDSVDIISATYTADQFIKVRFSQPIPLYDLARQTSRAKLISLEDTSAGHPCLGFPEARLPQADVVHFYFGSLTDSLFRLEIQYDSSQASIVYDSLAIRQSSEDKTVPTVTLFQPGPDPMFLSDARLSIDFSEPIDSSTQTSETFALWRDDDSQVPLTISWESPLRMTMTAALEAGSKYRFDLTEFDISDMAGNILGDSLQSYNFSILSDDSLGSVTGSVTVGLPDRKTDDIHLQFRKVKNNQLFSMVARLPEFKIDLPAGRYILSGFIDSDGDGKAGSGSVMPLVYSETQAVYPDTIAVRARFETAGIEFLLK